MLCFEYGQHTESALRDRERQFRLSVKSDAGFKEFRSRDGRKIVKSTCNDLRSSLEIKHHQEIVKVSPVNESKFWSS